MRRVADAHSLSRSDYIHRAPLQHVQLQGGKATISRQIFSVRLTTERTNPLREDIRFSSEGSFGTAVDERFHFGPPGR